ncbi:MAG: SIR2 family protein [Bacteroidetes bacterium]|nr:SIR2 family protein [Bacteroidota bacterium]
MNHELAYDAFLRVIKENTDSKHTFLLGAGSSISSGVQSATDCIWEWKRNIYITNNPNFTKQYSSYKSESVQKSLQKWIDTTGLYPNLNSEEEYSFFAQAAYPIEETRRKYFENICKGKEPQIGYQILCQLSKRGMINSVFTTNFDGLVEKAGHQSNITPVSISLANSEYIHRASSDSELLCVALHGDFKYGPLKNTTNELDTQQDTFVSALKKHLYDKHLIVMGYSGRDRSLMNALKKAYSEPGGGMLFWCGYGDEITPSVHELLENIKKSGRKGFYIATEGFDATMLHIAKTCYGGDAAFHFEIEKLLQVANNNNFQRTPFSIDVIEQNLLLRSNLLPISLPGEVFQVEASFNENEKVWQKIKNLIGDKKICSIPLKNCLYSIGTQSDIKEIFSSILRSDIKRTPVTYKEIRDGSSFKYLYLSSIVKAISELYNLETNGKDKVWGLDHYQTIKHDISYKVYDALELGLFFDDNIYKANPFCYLSINPTFYIKSEGIIPKQVKFEIGKNYHDNLLRNQPNVKFNEQIKKWLEILFPLGKKLQFEYPLNSGSCFKFAISPDTMHVSLMKNSPPKYKLNLPLHFSQKKIIHRGIQFAEPLLEFESKTNGSIITDFHPMRGLRGNRPYDYALNGNVFESEINLAVICPVANSPELYSFLNRLNRVVQVGKFNPDYLLDYPGFFSAFGIPLNIPEPTSDLWKDCNIPLQNSTMLKSAIGLAENIKRNIDQLDANRKKTVIVIFIPTIWNNITLIETENEKFDLHDYIKAYAAQKQIATQFIQEETLSDNLVCQVNWWLSLSFYVKSYRTPWVLKGLQEDTAFVGIGYSVDKRRDQNKVVLGCSHIYNSLGQGLKYKLSKVEDCSFDNQNNPYLSYHDAYKFGTLIRELFLNAIGELPKRVVVHKRTYFKQDEINGIVDSLEKAGIKQIDLIEINFEKNAKFVALFSNQTEIKPNFFPLSRGSCFLIDDYTALLWTHGIVPSVRAEQNSYFQGGKGIPIPIKIKKHFGTSNINIIATEILGLTKMNWNSFDLYSKLPATIQTSNEIARIGWLLNRFEGKTYDYRNFM